MHCFLPFMRFSFPWHTCSFQVSAPPPRMLVVVDSIRAGGREEPQPPGSMNKPRESDTCSQVGHLSLRLSSRTQKSPMQIIPETSIIKYTGPLPGRLGLMLSCEPQTEKQNGTLGSKASCLSHSAHQHCTHTLETGNTRAGQLEALPHIHVAF